MPYVRSLPLTFSLQNGQHSRPQGPEEYRKLCENAPASRGRCDRSRSPIAPHRPDNPPTRALQDYPVYLTRTQKAVQFVRVGMFLPFGLYREREHRRYTQVLPLGAAHGAGCRAFARERHWSWCAAACGRFQRAIDRGRRGRPNDNDKVFELKRKVRCAFWPSSISWCRRPRFCLP